MPLAVLVGVLCLAGCSGGASYTEAGIASTIQAEMRQIPLENGGTCADLLGRFVPQGNYARSATAMVQGTWEIRFEKTWFRFNEKKNYTDDHWYGVIGYWSGGTRECREAGRFIPR